jgi:2-dehydro-3-deoxyphosphooctonate aldolase (KDO 8-P synthase)
VRAGVAAGADALFLETHFNPPQAWCDAASMIPLTVLEPLLEQAMELGAMTRRWGLA